MSRFTEDPFAIPIEVEWNPRSPAQLLSQLGMSGKPKDVQREAVAEWLERNEPLPFLLMGLEAAHLVELPRDAAAQHHSAA